MPRARRWVAAGIGAALDTAGGQEAGDVSLALVADQRRVVTIVAFARAAADGYVSIGASNNASGPFRAGVRSQVLDLAAAGKLTVPMAAVFAFRDLPAAFAMLTSPHPPGKVAVLNEPAGG